jgi:hypothetical protein
MPVTRTFKLSNSDNKLRKWNGNMSEGNITIEVFSSNNHKGYAQEVKRLLTKSNFPKKVTHIKVGFEG